MRIFYSPLARAFFCFAFVIVAFFLAILLGYLDAALSR